MIDIYPDPETTFDLLFPHAFKEEMEIENAEYELVKNGMFRNRDYEHTPLSGSTADFAYDDEEYREYAKIMGAVPMEVHHTDS